MLRGKPILRALQVCEEYGHLLPLALEGTLQVKVKIFSASGFPRFDVLKACADLC